MLTVARSRDNDNVGLILTISFSMSHQFNNSN